MAFGGGVELSLTRGLFVRGEYQRTDFDATYKQDKVLIGAGWRF